MPPLALSRSLRSMPALRGIAPTSSATSASPNATLASSVQTTSASSGNAQSSSSIFTPSSAPSAGVISSSCRIDRRVGPEHRPGGDAEQQAVADLAGSTGDGNTNRCSHAGERRSPLASAQKPVSRRSRPSSGREPERLQDDVRVELLGGVVAEVDATVACSTGGPRSRPRRASQSSTVTFGCVAGSDRMISLLPAIHGFGALTVRTTTEADPSTSVEHGLVLRSRVTGPLVPSLDDDAVRDAGTCSSPAAVAGAPTPAPSTLRRQS